MQTPSRLTREQLKALPTPRLLKVLQVARGHVIGSEYFEYGTTFSEVYDRDDERPSIQSRFLIIDEAKEYFDLVKNICDTREHIEKHGGRRHTDGGTSGTTKAQRKGKRGKR